MGFAAGASPGDAVTAQLVNTAALALVSLGSFPLKILEPFASTFAVVLVFFSRSLSLGFCKNKSQEDNDDDKSKEGRTHGNKYKFFLTISEDEWDYIWSKEALCQMNSPT